MMALRGAALVPLVLLPFSLGCGGAGPAAVAARVNGRAIAPSQVIMLQAVARIDGQELTDSAALEQAIRDELVRQEAEKRAISVSEDAITDRVAAITAQVGGADPLTKALAAAGLSLDQFRAAAGDALLSGRLAAALLPSVHIDAVAIKRFYVKNKDSFTKPAAFDLGSIQVKSELLAKAVSRDLRRGKSFEKLAGRVTVDPIARKENGRLGWVLAASVPQELAPAVARLRIGETTRPVMSYGGWFILKLYGVRPLRTRALADVRTEIRAELVRRRRAEALLSWVEAARGRASVEIPQ